MNRTVRFPIRLKIMISLLVGITAVVSVITFTMATFFHDDKRSYINDWISIAAVSTAEESQALLQGYTRQLELASLIMLDSHMDSGERESMLQKAFDMVPELVEIVVIHEGQEVEVASDASVLQPAGLSPDDLREYRIANPLPLDRILAGEMYVRNSTISAKMPCMTLAFATAAGDAADPVVLSAVLKLDRLLGLGAKFKVFEIMLADAGGTLLAHPDVAKVIAQEPANLRPESLALEDGHRAGMTLEYTERGTEMIGGFARTGFGGITVAARLPLAAANLASRDLLKRLLGVAALMLLVVAVIGRMWARRIVRPVERLSEATRMVAKGGFDVQIDVESRDEIGALADSFNQMASELKTREEALAEANGQLIQSEKMAAFGQLGAGIAHEVKNPLAGILGCAQLSLMEIEDGTTLHKNLQIIEKETKRCRQIIDNLMRFARQEKALLEPTEINAVVEDALAIINHQMEIKQVKVIRDLAETLPQIHGNANQLQQVLMNLMINAQQAMEGEPGHVTVSTRMFEADFVEIVVSDDGPGIPEEIQRKLFEPFFTTKPTGKGTGLGLSVSFGIIEDHHGRIEVDSEVGRGTDFVIRLPILQEVDGANA